MESSDRSTGSGQRAKSNLLAIGSAAVLAVYGAGFFRTRAAAQRFSDASDQRRPAMPALPASTVAPSSSVVIHDDSAAVTPIPIQQISVAENAKPQKGEPRSPSPATPIVVAEPIEKSVPKVDSIVPEVVARVAIAEPVVAAPITVAVENSAAQSADKAVAGFKDGTYRGWGSSRHGDIEAAVEVHEGRITAAYITQCLTRYSCNWIAHLPGQVIARQSSEVDYVSGATQSGNAFYYAIVQALAKAK